MQEVMQPVIPSLKLTVTGLPTKYEQMLNIFVP